MITLAEYKKRRRLLAQQLPSNAIALIAGASEVLRNGDAHYPFRQDSNFYYLTGFHEPDAVLCIVAGKDDDSYLFNNPKEPSKELWTGIRLGQEAAPSVLGVKEAYSIAELDKRLPEFLANRRDIYCILGEDSALERKILASLHAFKGQIRRGVHGAQALCDLEPLISEMRLIKSQDEIALMRQAASISVEAHRLAMQKSKTAAFEYEIEATLRHEMIASGARHLAYESIVAGGKNACILHYTANNQPLRAGELLLIDAGAEFENYASDITRTFPIKGSFSHPQKELYALVLKAQKAGIACIKPGIPFSLIQQTIVEILTAGLCDLGLLRGCVETLIETGAYKSFYMHNSGHWLGLDVHDSGRYYDEVHQARPLEPGMVLTVEPGLYISQELSSACKAFQNMGIRIEDDILVTENGHENLTEALPVDIDAIEACCL